MSIGDILSITLQMILCLSILVVLHECGHFFPARWFKTRVEKFYLFFDPWFSIAKKKIGDTEYGIGWIPFGGYVKISGMIDESMDKEQMQGPAQPWEFRSKKAWQRLIIMVGGVVVNFILGFLIFGMLLFYYGKTYYKTSDLAYGITVDSIGMELGLRDGDVIQAIGSKTLDKHNVGTFVNEIVLNNAKEMQVLRDGNVIPISLDDKAIKILTAQDNKGKTIYAPRYPNKISSIVEGKIGDRAGLKKGDQILTVNGQDAYYTYDFISEIKKYKNKEVTLKILRGKDTVSQTVQLDSMATLSVYMEPESEFLKISREKYSLAQAIPGGIKEGISFLNNQLKAFGQMFKGKIKATESLGSILSIASLFDPTWNWEKFWKITAMLSILLGFFNILPIPALDGGYVLFLLWEIITGRKPSDKFMEYVTIAGFLIMISLMIFALGLDITRLFK